MRLRKKVGYVLEYCGVLVISATVKILPVVLTIRMGRTLGRLCAGIIKGRVQLAHTNLRHAFGGSITPEQHSRIIQSLFSLLGEAFVESIIFTQADIEKNVHIEGLSHVTSALEQDKGAIIIGPHFGLWELACYVLGTHLQEAATVYKPLKNPYVNNFLIKTREKIVHLNLIPSKNALRMVLGELRKGRAVVMLFDQNAGRDGVPATFFGRTASTYAAPAAFALRTGCPVIPAYIIKDSGFRKHRITFGEAFPLIRTNNKEKDILANTQQFNDYFETLIRTHPDQWFGWLHQRWKIPRSFTVQK